MRVRIPEIKSSEITPEREYVDRREFVRRAGAMGLAAVAVGTRAGLGGLIGDGRGVPWGADRGRQQAEKPNTLKDITHYNNYYEFGTDKTDPADHSAQFKPLPWTVRVEGMVKKPADYHFEDLVKLAKVEDRTYRLRCVEAWSMVIPWQGIPLADMLKKFEPTPSAKFVEFTTVYRPSEMPGQRDDVLPWPYVEGLRLDEAMHPLTLMATGLYGAPLPNQDGAPLRLVVPWKYGFKNIKAIVKIRLVDTQPVNTWQRAAPDEYGFYANVNPTVDHPRWTQASERRIGQFQRIPTLMFNGYADQVASLYTGMDLRKNY